MDNGDDDAHLHINGDWSRCCGYWTRFWPAEKDEVILTPSDHQLLALFPLKQRNSGYVKYKFSTINEHRVESSEKLSKVKVVVPSERVMIKS